MVTQLSPVKKRDRNLRAVVIVISVALHALLFLSLPRAHVTTPTLSTIELVDVPVGKTPIHNASRSPNRSARKNFIEGETEVAVQRTRSKLQFAPSFQLRANAAASELNITPDLTADGDVVDDPSAQWGSGSGQFARVKDLGRFDRLYDLIDAHVMYPSVLAYHQVSGTVNARLILTPQGKCDWHSSKIESTQSHLRLYVLDVLKQVCKRDLSRFARRSANSNLDLSFKFAITEHDDESLKAREKKVVGNVFLFYRNSQASIAEWHLGPFRGIFPVPMVAIDFAWLQENYDRVMHSRDPLKEFKSHLSEDPPS